RYFAESGAGKNVVQVIKNCIDTGELIEQPNGDGKKDRQPILPAEQRLVGALVLFVNRCNDLLQFLLVILFASQFQDDARFINAVLLHQPARAARNREQQDEKQKGRDGRYAQLYPPFIGSEPSEANQIIRQVSDQDSGHDV